MKALKWSVTIILALIVICLAFVYLSPDFDIQIVMSESMKPTIDIGDMIVTGPTDGPLGVRVRPGVIVTYQNDNELITHRVISVDGETLVTKGDATEDADPWPVSMSAVTGTYLFKIPYLGYISSFIRTKLGWFAVIFIPVLVLMAFIIKGIIKEALSKS
jgi:signal peptidase